LKKTNLYKMVPMEVYKDGHIQSIIDPVVYEKELEIILNGSHIGTTMCSPDAIPELGIGYLLGQGLLSTKDEVDSVTCKEEDAVYITTANSQEGNIELNDIKIRQSSIEEKLKYFPKLFDFDNKYETVKVLELIEELDSKAITFRKTGGVHSAALGSREGLLNRYEDIGRHNAVDKVLGYAFLHKVPLNDKCLVLSGRISSEIVLKVAQNGIPIIISRSAPTLLAVKMAVEVGMTIIGFARGSRFNVYSHSSRVNRGK